MSDLVTVQLPRQAAQRVLNLVESTGRKARSVTTRAPLIAAARALDAALKKAPRCGTCHGSHFTRNRAWDEFWRQIGEENPQLEEITPEYERMLEPRKAAFAAVHGPELLPCPECRKEGK